MRTFKSLAVAVALAAAFAAPAQAQIRITEVAPWSSGNSPVAADWFELTNIGSAAVNISGWKVDDNSFSFGSSAALNGVSGIAAGQSVIFVEGTSVQTNAFISNWFGAGAPAGFAIGSYTGTGIGLSTAGDGVIIFDAGGSQQAKVSFGASPSVSPTFRSFDNSIGLDNTTISALSNVGINGAFSVVHPLAGVATTEIGSPGLTAAVPEPESYALMLAGLALIGSIVRRRRFA